jgi:uncharacterized protein involved in response to NO
VRIDSRETMGFAPEQSFDAMKARELGLSRLLVSYIVAGLAFMLLPGTFLGVWNLISISNHRAADTISAPWIQAHGHAQIFGWIGSFILGIGFHSLPMVRRRFAIGTGWVCFALWTPGVLLRWATNVYLWHWRVLLPISAVMELSAFLLFFRAVSQHESAKGGESKMEPWIWVVIVATIGFLAALVMNTAAAVYVALRGASPAFPPALDQRFLVLCAWGFLVPFVWGFNAKWLPIFLGLRPTDNHLLGTAVAVNVIGVISAQVGWFQWSAVLVFLGAACAMIGLRLAQPSIRPAKTASVHASFPWFVRSAYVWLLIAAALGIWASSTLNSSGIWGASRHALTVGFLAVMVFSIGQRVLPAFSGMKLLFSPRLMLYSLLLLSIGCFLRVGSEVLAYQDFAQWAWKVLPVSALLELSGVTVFAVNLVVSFSRRPAHLLSQSSPVVATNSSLRSVK